MPTHQEIIKTHILNQNTFITATFSGRRKGQISPWVKVVLRPVLIKNEQYIQFSYFDGQKDISKNYRGNVLESKVDELLALPFNTISLKSTEGTLRVQITKKGKAILHQDKTSPPQTKKVDLSHDHTKALVLPSNQADPFLQALGIMTQAGQVKAKKRDKFWQINRFLELISQSVEIPTTRKEPLTVIDCGCGSAYLTFATYHYLSYILGYPTCLIGIDLKKDLLERRAKQAQKMGWAGLSFEVKAIGDFVPPTPPDIVLALHACDTATDDALAQAITWGSHYIFSVPCCHHHLQAQLSSVGQSLNVSHKPLLRHGILKERLGDILTDSFRALILRICGYRTDVIEFISSEHTAKNLMIRAIKTAPTNQSKFIKEYKALKDTWGVTPYLETILGSRFNSQL